MVRCVEKVREEPFVLFGESKGFGEGRQGQNLGTVDDLTGHDVLSVKCIQDEARIEPFGIVS